MGIGFGALGQISLFNIPGVDKGYIIGPPGTGIYVGITNSIAKNNGFFTQQLTAASTTPAAASSGSGHQLLSNQYWNYPQASILVSTAINGNTTTLQAPDCSLLLDTGYPRLYLGLQGISLSGGQLLPPSSGAIASSSTIAVTPAFANTPITWTITIGNSSAPPSPTSAAWNSSGTFVNTGISSLGNYWIFYGGKEGYWGMKAYSH